jgi:excisionase family DNA binding protein
MRNTEFLINLAKQYTYRMNDDAELPDISGYLSIKDAAKALGLATRTVYEYVSEGRIRAVRAADVILIPSEEIAKFKPNIAGRPRTTIPLWRISPTDNALQYTSLRVQAREDKLDEFRRVLDEIRRKKDHLFPGTIARYILGSNQAPGQIEIVLIWRLSIMPDETARQQALETFKQALNDVVDWTTAHYDDGTILMHA